MTRAVDITDGIRPKCRSRDKAIGAAAARQHGVITREQLLAIGLGGRGIRHRVTAGRLHRVHSGVYLVGHPTTSSLGRWIAAVLACGPGAVLSHHSAAALWGLAATSRSLADVTVPGRNRRTRPGIALHRVQALDRVDCSSVHRIAVTTVARTLLDLAAVMPSHSLGRAFEEAERRRLLDVGAIERLIRKSGGRSGVRALRLLLNDYRGPAPATRSELERRFLDLCRDAALPRPAVNVFLAGMEVDAVWQGQRLVVELDGHNVHNTRAAFERDRVRDTTLQLAGYRVLRVTHRHLEKEPDAVIDAIRSMLLDRGTTDRPWR